MLQAGGPLPEEAPEEEAPEEGAEGAIMDAREAAFDAALAEVAARVQPVYRGADGWLEQTRAGLTELLRFCDERPETARALVVDSIAWGPGVLERRGRVLDALAQALDGDRAKRAVVDVASHDTASHDADPTSAVAAQRPALAQGPAATPPPATAENLVGACVSLVHTRLQERAEGGSFLGLAPSLMSMIVHPYLGREAARRELERPLSDAGAQAAERDSQGPVETVRERSY